jgi:hypothetical protein
MKAHCAKAADGVVLLRCAWSRQKHLGRKHSLWQHTPHSRVDAQRLQVSWPSVGANVEPDPGKLPHRSGLWLAGPRRALPSEAGLLSRRCCRIATNFAPLHWELVFS